MSLSLRVEGRVSDFYWLKLNRVLSLPVRQVRWYLFKRPAAPREELRLLYKSWMADKVAGNKLYYKNKSEFSARKLMETLP